MRKIAIVAGMLLALGACKDKWDKAIGQLEGYKDKMCACKDKACAEDVHKQYREWQKSLMADMGKDEKPPEKLIEKGDKIEADMKECRKKFRDEAPPAGATPPAAPEGAPPAEAPKTP